jgi:predicted Na+-dependent transporter
MMNVVIMLTIVFKCSCSMNIEMSKENLFNSDIHRIGQVLDYVIVPTITLSSFK